MTDIDNIKHVIDTAQQATVPQALEIGRVYSVAQGNGTSKTIDLTGDAYLDTPARKTGNATVRDTASFLAYYAKHSDEGTEVYADVEQRTVTAVLDAHTADGARWAFHKVTLALRTTQAWRDWTDLSGKLMDQNAFAEHLEDHLADIRQPAAAEMLEIAQSIQAATKVDFKSSTRLNSGERQLEYVETIAAKAGHTGQLTIPETFTIGVKVFEGAELGDEITARLRYRIENNGLRIGFRLDRPEDALAAAFADVVTAIEDGVSGGTVLNGTPA